MTFRLPLRLIVSVFGVVRTGQPFNITTGRDDNGDTLFADWPAFAEPSDVDAIETPWGIFDPRPEPGDQIIPRNYGREPGEARVDLHVSQGFAAGPLSVRLGADIVNVFNRANRSRLNGVLTSTTFGAPKRAPSPRRVELFLRVSF